jgi:proteasome lid subunit RPN8/RPN11
MTTIDLETLTEQEMREAGWRQLGTRAEPHWQRVKGKGVENFFGTPRGRRSKPSASATTSPRVTDVVITRSGWQTILSVMGQFQDDRETGGCLLCSREGNTIYVHETTWPGIDDHRTVDEMQVKDGAGFALEEARQSMGVNWIYAGLIHSHPRGTTLPSKADEIAFAARARQALGDTFTGLIVVPRDHEFGRTFDDIAAYVCQRINGRHQTVPVRLTIEE